jgi:hypothetical protein
MTFVTLLIVFGLPSALAGFALGYWLSRRRPAVAVLGAVLCTGAVLGLVAGGSTIMIGKFSSDLAYVGMISGAGMGALTGAILAGVVRRRF